MKIIAFTIADKNNEKYAQMLVNSFKKFHPDIKIKVYGDDFIQKQLKFDTSFFYKATPLIASKLLKEYDLVIKLDADQIITGDLSALFAGDYDLGVVYNGNPTDVKVYGNISIQGVDVREYFNCGLVAMTNKKLVNHWLNLCNSKYFNRFQYREQDLMNVIAHFGEYSIKCFDDSDSWYGLRSKGEWGRVVLEDNKLFLYPNEYGYPNIKTEIKVIHWAGGNLPNKMNYRLYFNEQVIDYLNNLVKG